MKSVLINNVIRYLLSWIIAVVFFLTIFSEKSYSSDINTVRALSGFIRHIYLNVDTVNNGDSFCVLGSDDISIQIKSMFENSRLYKELGDEVDRSKDYHECRVIYIAKSKEKESKYVVQFFGNKGALTIGIFSSFVPDGGMMNVDIGRRNFELTVNELMIKKSGVKIDSSIVSLIVR